MNWSATPCALLFREHPKIMMAMHRVARIPPLIWITLSSCNVFLSAPLDSISWGIAAVCRPSMKLESRMAGTSPLLSYLPRIHNRFTATAAYRVRLPFQLGLCYKGASVADGENHLSPVGN